MFPAFALAPLFLYSPSEAQSIPQTPSQTPEIAPGTTTAPQVASSTPSAFDPLLCRCVQWLRERRGINIRGDAWTIEGNVKLADAQIGDVILLDYSGLAHAALITGWSGKGAIVEEANFKRCQRTVREVDLGSEHIRGIYRP